MIDPTRTALICVAALISLAGAQTRDNSLTGNDITHLAGNQDTLWMVTSKGLNFTILPQDTSRPLQWHGFRDNQWETGTTVLGFGAQRALIGLAPTARRELGVWIFDHVMDRGQTLRQPWNTASVSRIAATHGFSSAVRSIAYRGGSFWLACGDGGLVKIDTGSIRTAWPVYLPGSRRAFTVASFPPDTLAGYPDSLLSVEAVAATDSGPLYVATPRAVWRFNPEDTTWEKLPSTVGQAGAPVLFRTLFIRPDGTSPLYSRISPLSASPSFRLHRFDPADSSWQPCLDRDVHALGFGPGDTLYLLRQNQLFAYRENFPLEQTIGWEAFRTRMELAAQDQSSGIPTILRDVLYLPRANGGGALCLASDNGLFLSRNEHPAHAQSPFVWVRRPLPVSRGLNKSYAYPSIIAPYEGWRSATIAYSLVKAGSVTITIYDWNMDFVKTLVSNAPRKAGDQTPEGRSTQPADSWDGTDRLGRPVAPGVYYYRITSSSGGQGFGKIVVAR